MSTVEEMTPDMRKIDKRRLMDFAASQGIKVTDDVGSTAKKLIEKWISLPDDDLAECDNCDGRFPSSIEGPCPYCGTEEDENVSVSDSVVPPPMKSNGVLNGTLHASLEDDGKDTKKKSKKKSTALTTTEKKDKSKTTALASQVTEKDLDEAVARVERLKRDMGTDWGKSNWKLGRAIHEIYEKQLYKQRTKPDGSAAYKGFKEFVKAELDMSHTTAFFTMDISQQFTEEQAIEYGISKLRYVLQAPKEDRQLLLDKAGEGASKRQLEAMAREAKEKRGGKQPTRDKSKAGHNQKDGKDSKAQASMTESAHKKKANEKKKKADRQSAITVAKLLEKQQIKLFKKPEKRSESIEEQPRAKRLADRPIGQLTLENGVVMTFEVKTSGAGELFAIVSAHRP